MTTGSRADVSIPTYAVLSVRTVTDMSMFEVFQVSRHTVRPAHSTSCVGTASSQLGQCTV